MKKIAFLLATALCLGTAAAQAASVNVDGLDDVYNLGVFNSDGSGGNAAVAIGVTGLSSITFSVGSGETISLNSGGNFNDADGVGAAPSSSSNSGANNIAGLVAPGAGYLTGAFVGSTLGAAPSGLDFSGGTSFASLSPELQQAFFIGDGLTGNGTGTTQTFFVPTGATTLYLGISDACGYNGSPSCYTDNSGTFTVTYAGVAAGGVPEPATWAMFLIGFGAIGFAVRGSRKQAVIA